jgi:hypothetical protein
MDYGCRCLFLSPGHIASITTAIITMKNRNAYFENSILEALSYFAVWVMDVDVYFILGYIPSIRYCYCEELECI